jgi:hypothetical protein
LTKRKDRTDHQQRWQITYPGRKSVLRIEATRGHALSLATVPAMMRHTSIASGGVF